MSQAIKWTLNGKQWHYGMVISDYGTHVEVEYTHSMPASNAQAGRIMQLDKSLCKIRYI